MKNQVQLIAYVDRFSGGGMRELQQLLDGPFAGLFGGVHLLPFFWPTDEVGHDVHYTAQRPNVIPGAEPLIDLRVIDGIEAGIGAIDRPEERQ